MSTIEREFAEAMLPAGKKLSQGGNIIPEACPTKLGPEHKTILALRATGLKPFEIAPIVGYAPTYVALICRHPDAEELLAQLTTDHINGIVTDVGQAIQGSAQEAYLKVVELMRSAKPEIQRDCAFDLLDRAGFTAKANNAPPPVQFGEKGAETIKRALLESKREVIEPRQVESSSEVREADWEIIR